MKQRERKENRMQKTDTEKLVIDTERVRGAI